MGLVIKNQCTSPRYSPWGLGRKLVSKPLCNLPWVLIDLAIGSNLLEGSEVAEKIRRSR